MRISQSKVKLRRRCHAAFSFKYVDNLRKKVKSRPLQVGSIIHDMLEAHANGDDPMAVLEAVNLANIKLFTAERELYGDIITDIRSIMGDYFAYWKKEGDLIYIRHNKQNAEHKFELDIDKDLTITGKIDAFAKRRKSKLKFLVEHKTFKRKPSEDFRWRNVQSSVYLRICEMLGWGHFDGVVWDYIGNKPPTEPEVLKSGLLSRKKIVTLPSVVKRVMEENNLSTAHYKEYIQQVEANQSDYFFRSYTPVNNRVVDVVFDDFMSTAREIVEGKEDRTRSIDLHCSYCDYEAICRAELQGLDVDFVKQREYDHVEDEINAETPIEEV